jgi:hypothetical protein
MVVALPSIFVVEVLCFLRLLSLAHKKPRALGLGGAVLGGGQLDAAQMAPLIAGLSPALPA